MCFILKWAKANTGPGQGVLENWDGGTIEAKKLSIDTKQWRCLSDKNKTPSFRGRSRII